MGRCVGVRIIHPRMRYAPLLWLDRAAEQRRRFTTVSDDQTVADVEIHVLENPSGSWTSRQTLHVFHLTDLHPVPEVGAAIDITAQYDGHKQLTITILVDGRQRDTVSLEIHPEPRRRILLPVAAAVLLILAIGGGALYFLRPAGPGMEAPPPQPAARPETEAPAPEPEPSGAATADSAAGPPEGAAAESDTPAPEEPGAGANEQPNEQSAGQPEAEPEPEEQPPEPAIQDEQRTVYFSPNETFLTDRTKAELRELAALLQDSPDAEVTLIGHTAVFGEEEEQWVISRERAENAADYLQQQGWSPRVPPELDWRGPAEPLTRDPDRQQINRRVEILID